jgi:hypothetical protein
MTDSRQLDILKRLTTYLEGITVATGYDFDLANRVFRGRRVYGDSDPIPMVSIVEHLNPDIVVNTAGQNSRVREETWILLVQGWVDSAKDAFPTDEAYQLKANVEKRLFRLVDTNEPGGGDPMYPDEYMLGLYGKSISGISIGPGITSGPREGVSSKAFFYLPVGIGLIMDLSDLFLP